MNHDQSYALLTQRSSFNLYNASTVRDGERAVVARRGIELYQLMRHAGEAIAAHIQEHYPQTKQILVCCGQGHNGGDGYITARILAEAQISVSLWQVGEANNLTGDVARARDAWLATGGKITTPLVELPEDVDLIVDGLLGIGARGAPRPAYQVVIEAINRHSAPVVSIDLPSGLNPDTGAQSGAVVKADQTLTLVAPKMGLVTGQARAWTGEVFFTELDTFQELSELYPPNAQLMTTTPTPLKISIPARSPVVHKGTCGRVVVIGGSVGMGGALCLASEAAARAGAGLVTAVTAPEHLTPLMARRPEVMTLGVATQQKRLKTPRISSASSIVIGPGLGLDEWGIARWSEVLSAQERLSTPWLIDADALTLLAEHADDLPAWWHEPNRAWAIITPHPGEAARLLGCTTLEVEADRFKAARALSIRYRAVVVLKGAGTIIDQRGRTPWVCGLGNPGMASGGMGDVLSGLIGSLLAQGLSPWNASVLGVWLHSRSADLAHQRYDDRGLLAADLFDTLATAFRELR